MERVVIASKVDSGEMYTRRLCKKKSDKLAPSDSAGFDSLSIHEPISFLRFSCSGRYGEHIRERETGVLETVWLENQN